MNWHLVGILFLVLVITLIISATVVLYIRHWAGREAASNAQQPAHEGHYFIRYLPPGLQPTEHMVYQGQPQARRNSRLSRLFLQRLFSSLLVLGLTGALASATYLNRDKLASPIDLTEQELKAISISSHRWKTQETQALPVLQQQLLYFKARGLVLVSDKDTTPWPQSGQRVIQMAERQWHTFAEKHQLKTVSCSWSELVKCRQQHPDWLYVILPGHWYKDSMNELLTAGSKVLLYGPPRQIFAEETAAYEIEGLSFSHTSQPNPPDMALVADRELTLGFDAGLVLELKSAFADYHADSAKPQAISITSEHLAGGAARTRLFARSTGDQGRLVWMDFSPNGEDHANELNQPHFKATLASVFRYLQATPYASWANWPAGAPFAALMEEDTEDQFANAERVAEFFKERNYPITWYMLSNVAQKHRALTRQLAATGEVACHGDNHQNFARNDIQTQHVRIARCKKVLEAITGKPVLSFRPPEEQHNTDTLSAILNNQMTHFMAKRSGDRFAPTVYVSRDNQQSLISIPRMNTDDYLLWDEYDLTEADSISLLEGETDWIRGVGGLLAFSFHTQYMGEDQYFNTVKALADYISASQAYFATASDLADWWRLRLRLLQNETVSDEEIRKFQPVRLSVNSHGELQRQRVNNPKELALLAEYATDNENSFK